MASFDPSLLAFLSDLAAHNDRDWFRANKKRYDGDVKQPAFDFIEAFQGPLHELSPHFLAVPKAQGGSLFRIHRDTRFSKDKTPYKTNCAMQFRHASGSRDVHAPGFYFNVEPGASMLGSGLYLPPNPVLHQIREAIVAESDRWEEVLQEARSSGWSWMDTEKDLKRVPRGFDKDHRHARDLKRKAFAVMQPVADEDLGRADLEVWVAERFRATVPFMQFLCEAVGVPF